MMNRIDVCLRLNTPGKTLLILLICWVIFGFSGCFKVGTLPQSTANLYPDKPGKCSIPGSSGQAIASRTMPITFDELFDAANKTLFRRGVEVDYKNMKKGMLSGKGYWKYIAPGGPNQFKAVFAVYVEEIDQKPTTKLTIVMDNMDSSFIYDGAMRLNVQDFIIDVQKLLATLQ